MTTPVLEDRVQSLLDMIYDRSRDIADRVSTDRTCPVSTARLRIRPDIQVLVGLVLAYCTLTQSELPQPYLAAYDEAVRAVRRGPVHGRKTAVVR